MGEREVERSTKKRGGSWRQRHEQQHHAAELLHAQQRLELLEKQQRQQQQQRRKILLQRLGLLPGDAEEESLQTAAAATEQGSISIGCSSHLDKNSHSSFDDSSCRSSSSSSQVAPVLSNEQLTAHKHQQEKHLGVNSASTSDAVLARSSNAERDSSPAAAGYHALFESSSLGNSSQKSSCCRIKSNQSPDKSQVSHAFFPSLLDSEGSFIAAVADLLKTPLAEEATEPTVCAERATSPQAASSAYIGPAASSVRVDAALLPASTDTAASPATNTDAAAPSSDIEAAASSADLDSATGVADQNVADLTDITTADMAVKSVECFGKREEAAETGKQIPKSRSKRLKALHSCFPDDRSRNSRSSKASHSSGNDSVNSESKSDRQMVKEASSVWDVEDCKALEETAAEPAAKPRHQQQDKDEDGAAVLRELEEIEQLLQQRSAARLHALAADELEVARYTEELWKQQQLQQQQQHCTSQGNARAKKLTSWTLATSDPSIGNLLRLKLRFSEQQQPYEEEQSKAPSKKSFPFLNWGAKNNSDACKENIVSSFLQDVLVVVGSRQNFELLAERIGDEQNLPRCCCKEIRFEIDGDTCPHHLRFEEPSLELEDDVQITVKLPPKRNSSAPHTHHKPSAQQKQLTGSTCFSSKKKHSNRGTKRGRATALERSKVSVVPLDDGSFLILDDEV